MSPRERGRLAVGCSMPPASCSTRSTSMPISWTTTAGLRARWRTDGARRDLQDAIFAAGAAWHEGDDSCDQGGPRPLPEHVLGQDPTSVFLARLVLPATLPASGGRPIRTAREVVVDNRSRRFAYPPAALARWVGL